MKHTSMMLIAGGTLLAVFTFRPSIAGQTEASQDTLGALLVEVRGLRAAMEQMASAGPRIQLAMGRLQLQEQRINTLVRRADGLHEAVAAAVKQAGALQDRLGNTQRELDANTEPEHRLQLQAVFAMLKQEFARASAEVQRLQNEESDVAAQVASEQARRTDINQRLEELDRALARVPDGRVR
jgi:chromosome segregation ATPase